MALIWLCVGIVCTVEYVVGLDDTSPELIFNRCTFAFRQQAGSSKAMPPFCFMQVTNVLIRELIGYNRLQLISLQHKLIEHVAE